MFRHISKEIYIYIYRDQISFADLVCFEGTRRSFICVPVYRLWMYHNIQAQRRKFE